MWRFPAGGVKAAAGSSLAQIFTDETHYTSGDLITVTVIDGPGHPANVVAIFRDDDDPLMSSPLDWAYLASNDKVLPATGVRDESVTLSSSGFPDTFKKAVLLSRPPAATRWDDDTIWDDGQEWVDD